MSAVVPAAQPRLLLTPNSVDLGRRPLCTDTSFPVRVRNLGCDSAIVSNVHFLNGNTFLLLSSADSVIPPHGAWDETIIYYPKQHGVSVDTLSMHIASADSTYSLDTSIICRVEVTRGAAILAAGATSYDLGTTSICQERDTFVVIQNTGCDTVCDSTVTLSTSAFQLAKPWRGGCLAPGERDTVRLVTQVDTSGHVGQNIATLTITSNADTALPPIALMREVRYPAAWLLSISPPDSAYAGQPVTYRLIQHGALPNDDTAIDFVLHFDDDLLTFQSADEPFVSAQAQAGGIALHIAPVPADSVIATLHFTAYLAPKQHATISADSIKFSSQPMRPSDCIALAQVDTSGFTIRTLCGSNEISKELNGLPLTLDAIVPNPSHSEVTLYYSLAGVESITGSLTLEDVLGRTRLSQTVSLEAGVGRAITLDLSGIPSGVYSVRLGTAAARRIVKE